MATKQSRGRRSRGKSKAQPRSYSELYGNSAAGSAAPVAAAKPAQPKTEEKVARSSSDSVNWAGEYGQVFGDLRQLLMISAVLFVLMIVLGFVL